MDKILIFIGQNVPFFKKKKVKRNLRVVAI